MARTTLTADVVPAAFAKVPATLNFVAGDVANGNDVAHTGREMVMVQNTDPANPHTVTVKSKEINNRLGDSNLVVPANGFAVFQQFPTSGWQQTDGKLFIDVTDAQLKIAVIKLP